MALFCKGEDDRGVATNIGGGKGVRVPQRTVYARGMTVVVSRVYTPRQDDETFGVLTTQINHFDGVSVGKKIYVGGRVHTSTVERIHTVLDASLFKVYRCWTETGSIYEVVATPRR